MPLITQESVREILEGADLVELIRGRVNLAKRGNRWTGRCPFHDERTPSFSIIPPENKRYYCHGCGASGDAVRWMMEKEGAASFPDALESLAERFGIEVRYEQASPEEEARRKADQRRLELLERATAFYAEYLWRADEAAEARTYLQDRGFDEALLRTFRVGYAPSGGAVLAGRAIREGFSRGQLEEAGLARLRGGRAGDFFTARIMFPIADGRGRVLGFGGRTLDPNQRAKYVNSPEGPRFSKRRLLFGLDHARAPAARAGWVMVVEGYTDVLALHKSGVPQAVACMGTSLTSEQISELRRAAPRIRLCFDSDAAGERAAFRTAQAAGEHLIDLEAVAMPGGRDPGDMAISAAELEELARRATEFDTLVTFLIRSRASRAGASASEREQAFREIADLLRQVPDSVEKDEGVRLAAGLLQLSRSTEDRLREAARTSSVGAARVNAPALTAETMRERHVLVLAAALPRIASSFLKDLPDDAMSEPAHREALDLLRAGTEPEDWPEHLEQLGTVLRADPSAEAATEAELTEAVYRLQLPVLERRAAALRASGNAEGALRVQQLVNRLRQALRGEG
ncbi:MAG: DNA primase [Actinobacteria bacterium]|nr:DNA primase [Thermoleophilia bacterium]MCB9010713.1 DNA primase [Actinomycetota bacterium]